MTIVDIGVRHKHKGEQPPSGFQTVDRTVGGHDASTNAGASFSLFSGSKKLYLCVRKTAGPLEVRSWDSAHGGEREGGRGRKEEEKEEREGGGEGGERRKRKRRREERRGREERKGKGKRRVKRERRVRERGKRKGEKRREEQRKEREREKGRHDPQEKDTHTHTHTHTLTHTHTHTHTKREREREKPQSERERVRYQNNTTHSQAALARLRLSTFITRTDQANDHNILHSGSHNPPSTHTHTHRLPQEEKVITDVTVFDEKTEAAPIGYDVVRKSVSGGERPLSWRCIRESSSLGPPPLRRRSTRHACAAASHTSPHSPPQNTPEYSGNLNHHTGGANLYLAIKRQNRDEVPAPQRRWRSKHTHHHPPPPLLFPHTHRYTLTPRQIPQPPPQATEALEEIVLILPNKESTPRGTRVVNRSLNQGSSGHDIRLGLQFVPLAPVVRRQADTSSSAAASTSAAPSSLANDAALGAAAMVSKMLGTTRLRDGPATVGCRARCRPSCHPRAC